MQELGAFGHGILSFVSLKISFLLSPFPRAAVGHLLGLLDWPSNFVGFPLLFVLVSRRYFLFFMAKLLSLLSCPLFFRSESSFLCPEGSFLKQSLALVGRWGIAPLL